MKIQSGQTLLFIGDSITDAGRKRPVGEGDGLGGGYPSQVNALLTATYPERRIRVLNTGISGNRVPDLAGRWQTDVMDLKPDWLSIMIGTNDVWRQFDRPNNPELHVLPPQFESIYTNLLRQTRPGLKGLILLTPFLVEKNESDAMRMRMIEYGKIVKKLSKEFKASFIDTQALYNDAMKYVEPKTLAGDRVHPSQIGHAVLTRGILKAIDYRV
ncbi:MAG: SGNH/GDSL hydrolase family protein [Armatimonas sp.]